MAEAPTDPLRWTWSDEAKMAFLGAAGVPRIPFLNKALNAALAVETPALFERQVEGMIATITTHPVLGGRVLHLKPGPDGTVRLKIDADLIRYILFDELPEGVLDGTDDNETEGHHDDE